MNPAYVGVEDLFLAAHKYIASKVWTQEVVEEVKLEIREHLASFEGDLDPSARLTEILDKLAGWQESTTPEALLYQYVLSMSALVHHTHHGGLTSKDIRKLKDSIQDILRLQNIKPGSSRLTNLHSEFRTIMSQIHWHQGAFWQAAWDQQLAVVWAKDLPPAAESHYQLALGRRLLRASAGPASIALFTRALESAATPAHRFACLLSLANAKRLCGMHSEAAELLQLMRSDFPEGETNIDVMWEDACLEFVQSQDCRALLRLTKAGGIHHTWSYIAEARLYAYSCPAKGHITALGKVETLSRKGILTLSNAGLIYSGLLALEDCYDIGLPVMVRLTELEKCVSSLSRVISIEKEALMLASAARWLSRTHMSELAALMLQRYRHMILALTGQATKDPLGLVDDLLARPWAQF